MDGALWEEQTPIPGLTDLFFLLRKKHLLFFKNNSTFTDENTTWHWLELSLR
jgi:ribonucleotide monophosphatase NagD (HAD superfamily)